MSGFDEGAIFYSSALGMDDTGAGGGAAGDTVNRADFKRRFREFLRTYHETYSFDHKYRDALKRNYNLKKYLLEVNLEDFNLMDAELHDRLKNQPAEFIPIFEEAAREVADEITRPRPEGEEEIQDIQVMLTPTNEECIPLRSLKSDFVSKLVTISGIVVAASGIRVKAQRVAIQCRSCKNSIMDIPIKPGFDGYMLPRKCNGAAGDQPGQPPCGLDPFFIMPDKCKCVDIQTLKLQESSEDVPNGELPRHTQLYCDRYLCEKVAPGNKVTLTGIYSIRQLAQGGKKGANDRVAAAGIRTPYIRVVGIRVETESRAANSPVTPEDEEKFRQFANRPDCYEVIARSIAPSIYGSIDIKKSIACLLFGGSRKRHPDGLIRRGDINLLLLGDPGTAKSQLLKFVERVSPVGVYTSGKGSSAAGLTASVIRDAQRNFVLEGGAMVLADGGVVCIDEFDKMREDDRVAIHEAMEQQTISIAKAGITTTLNTRCSVLAAANSVFGRWDDTKGDDNIDFMPTILSRFDMIYIVKDEHDFHKDTTLAKHVISVHMNATQALQQHHQQQQPETEGEISLGFLKKYIAYCRSRCGPRISAEGAEKLRNRYVLMRSGSKQHEQETQKRMSIPITVRQLEAVIRITESLAKMRLVPFATEQHVDEALRLFQVSTLEAAMSGSLAGAEGFTSVEQQDVLNRIEKQIKKRFPIGAQISEHAIVTDFLKQQFNERAIQKVIHAMIRRGELQHRLQRKVLYRLR